MKTGLYKRSYFVKSVDFSVFPLPFYPEVFWSLWNHAQSIRNEILHRNSGSIFFLTFFFRGEKSFKKIFFGKFSKKYFSSFLQQGFHLKWIWCKSILNENPVVKKTKNIFSEKFRKKISKFFQKNFENFVFKFFSKIFENKISKIFQI